MPDQTELFPQRRMPIRAFQLVKRSPGKTTQDKLDRLASLQAATSRSQFAQSELAMGIERDLAEGGDIEDGPLYFDRRLMLARSKHGGEKVVGE